MSPIPVSPTEMNSAEAWDASAPILPPGKHVVTIVDEDDTQKSSGNHPEIRLQLRADDAQEIRDWIVVIPQTYGKVKQLFEAAGKPIIEGQTEVTSAVLRGQRVLVTVGQKADRNDPSKMRATVMGYEPVPGGPAGTPSADAYANVGQGANAVNDDIPF
jgi:hypothetical protein